MYLLEHLVGTENDYQLMLILIQEGNLLCLVKNEF